MKTTWKEKLYAKKDLPQIKTVTEKGMERWGAKVGDTFVIPSPVEVYELMSKVPKGKVITTTELRQKLAKKHKTTITCPLTTGIFAWVAAHASEEMNKTEGKKLIPYWRTLKVGGEINPKFPLDIEGQKNLLRQEGFEFKTRGKKTFVADFESKLWNEK